MPKSTWQKSSYCGEGDSCIHVDAPDEATVQLTESSDPAGTVLSTTPAAFAALLAHLKGTSESPAIHITPGPGDQILLSTPDATVTTTRDKWHAFALGARAGEFDHFTNRVSTEKRH